MWERSPVLLPCALVLKVPATLLEGNVVPALYVHHEPEFIALREQLRQDLAAVGSGQMAPRTISRLKASARRVVMAPGGTSGRLIHYLPENHEALLAHVVMSMRDDALEHEGGDLRRCKLESCGLFFLSSDRTKETGRPREAYCSNECMLKQHRSTSSDRVRRYRERQRRAAKHK